MKRSALDVIACPACHGELTLAGAPVAAIQAGSLSCARCARDFPIVGGIPYFLKPAELTGLNRRFSRLYDWFSWIYAAFSRVAFAYIGMNEEQGRREITDRLDPRGGRVLEISIGPGVNLPYLVRRPDVGEIFGLDISLGQLRRCQGVARRKGWGVDLFLGNGERLPFRDGSFDGVFHVGGINFFNNRQAIDEMIRVARPGARILIADETEKGARGYEKFIPGFKNSFGGKRDPIQPPVELVPASMLETRVYDAWKGWLYCLEFRKP
jgi:SAM-dependent methyltransferase